MSSLLGQYIYNVALAFDRFANALLGGDPEWSLSERMGQAIRQDQCLGCYYICRALHLVDPNHCKRVYDPKKQHKERILGASLAFVLGMSLILVAILLFI